MSKVVLISPPYMKLSYPNYDMPLALTKGCDYMNPGLLICSAVLDAKNVSNKIVKVIDPTDAQSIISQLDNDTIMVGISCTCAWEYLESLKIAEIIKKEIPTIKIVMSGWQIKSIKEQVFKDSLNIDYIILGDAEYTIYNLYNKIINNSDESINSIIASNSNDFYNSNDKFPQINFQIINFKKFPQYQKYLPYVEESRNCPFSCQFCLNSCVKDRYQNVPIDIFKKNVDELEKVYGENANANLLAANFGVNYRETKKKLEYLKTKKIKWNIELHVDNRWEYYIDDLREAGIAKASIGFESGSVKTLKLMNKTSNPENYLIRLERMLEKLNEQGIKPSLNLLIDYRDDYESICETLSYLEKNKLLINKVKANFMFAFEGILNNIDYSYNPNIIIDEYGKKIHAYPILPNGISLEEIINIIDEIEKGNYDVNIMDSYALSLKKIKKNI